VSAGQVRLLLDRERITPELEARLTEVEQRGLETLRRAIAFGETIGLAPSQSHRYLVDREGRELVTVVTAAPTNRLEAVTWWFPVVGRISYRGYFDAERAHAFADSLGRTGLDTYVRPAAAYSTLGWFDDPLPRAVLRYQPFEIADTVLHERMHETVYVPGDSTYNESIAVFASHEAVLRMYADEPKVRDSAAAAFADQLRFAALLERLASELQDLYDEEPTDDSLSQRRAAVFERYRTTEFESVPWQAQRYARFPEAPLSNAYVVARRTYLADLPCFRSELAASEGDLAAFIRAHREDPGRRATCPSGG
jgi:predicted aminopeptidase